MGRLLKLLGGAAAPSLPSIAGQQLWLDAADPATWFQDDAGTTPAVSDGDPVGRIDDKSGNARHATQATGTRRGALKLAVQNGKPVVRFDGVDDYLTFATNFTLGTAFVVANFTGGATFPTFNAILASTTNQGVFRGAPGTTSWRSNGPPTDGVLGATLAVDGVTTLNLVTLSAFHVSDGTVVPLTLAGYELGRDSADDTRAWQGDLCELILYDTALSAGNRALVRAYLKAKWGTP